MTHAFVALLIGTVLLYASSAVAVDKAAARKACMADYQKYCSGVSVGGGRVKKCLNDNLDKLTPDCRAAVIERNEAPAASQEGPK